MLLKIILNVGDHKQGGKIDIDEGYNLVVTDYNKTIELDPDFAYAYYNRAYVRCIYKDYTGAVTDFGKSTRYQTDLSDGYYNRGITLIYLDDRPEACADLNKASELGINEVFNVIKRYCNK